MFFFFFLSPCFCSRQILSLRLIGLRSLSKFPIFNEESVELNPGCMYCICTFLSYIYIDYKANYIPKAISPQASDGIGINVPKRKHFFNRIYSFMLSYLVVLHNRKQTTFHWKYIIQVE
uniref:Secreted protein n=1 Tax=Rhizophora mucronata TaxID=61149 RepID=A0A2P2NGW7_RHIMU